MKHIISKSPVDLSIGLTHQFVNYLNKLDEPQLDSLINHLESNPTFDSDYISVLSLSEKLDLNAEQQRDLEFTIKLFSYFYSIARDIENENANNQESAKDIFYDIFSKENLDGTKSDKIWRVLKRRRDVNKQVKMEWLSSGLIESATGFFSFVDLRPCYSEDGQSIEEYIPISLFKVDVENDYGENKGFVFQLTESGVQSLKEAVDDLVNKLNILNNNLQ